MSCTGQRQRILYIGRQQARDNCPGIAASRTNSRLERVSNDQRGASRVPLRAEWRPRQLLSGAQVSVQLRPGLGNCRGRVRVSIAVGESVVVVLHSAGYVMAVS